MYGRPDARKPFRSLVSDREFRQQHELVAKQRQPSRLILPQLALEVSKERELEHEQAHQQGALNNDRAAFYYLLKLIGAGGWTLLRGEGRSTYITAQGACRAPERNRLLQTLLLR